MKTVTLFRLIYLGIGTTILSSIISLSYVINPKKTVENRAKAIEKLENSSFKTFNKYWDDGKAELTSYELKQARYGEIHEGEAVLIFVTEPFSRSEQVKLDNWRNKEDREDVLKLNFVKKFDTGIYPYSTMLSAFSSLKSEEIIKITSSVQEWCGQVFMQFNNRNGTLDYFGRSYFQHEGDQEHTFSEVLLEDELWNLIRLNPDNLPTGEQQLIPSTLFLRFNHHEVQVVDAQLNLNQKNGSSFYEINYNKPEPRTITIEFETAFPHTILGWEEEYEDIAWNSEREVLKTKATIKKSIRLDYWNKNKIEHKQLKQLLH